MHVDAKPLNQYPAHLRWLFGRQKKALGQVLLPGLIWGRVPVLHLLFTCFWQYLDRRKSPLDPALRALVHRGARRARAPRPQASGLRRVDGLHRLGGPRPG